MYIDSIAMFGIQSQAEGNFIRCGQTSMLRIAGASGRVLGFQSDSHEKTLSKGGVSNLIRSLWISSFLLNIQLL